jgi:hypothetical protein
VSWEPFERWPDESTGHAFRGASQPVLARRDGITLAERMRLFWRSSPDLPAQRVVAKARLTEQHVYVERRDGSRERVARSMLRGVRRDGPALVIGVREGEDVFLLERRSCALQSALIASAVHGGELRFAQGVKECAILAAIAAAIAFGLFLEYGIGRPLVHLRIGLYTSETMLGFYGALLASGIGLLAMLWWPSRIRVDATGVERRRGLVPWLVFRRPPEDFAAVGTLTEHADPHRGANRVVAVRVSLELRQSARFGTVWPTRYVLLDRIVPKNTHYPTDARTKALDVAERVRGILGL